jgi:hypothetical protein
MQSYCCPMCAAFGNERRIARTVTVDAVAPAGLGSAFSAFVRRGLRMVLPFYDENLLVKKNTTTAFVYEKFLSAAIGVFVADPQKREKLFFDALIETFFSRAGFSLSDVMESILTHSDEGIRDVIVCQRAQNMCEVRSILSVVAEYKLNCVYGVVADQSVADIELQVGDYNVCVVDVGAVGKVFMIVKKHVCVCDNAYVSTSGHIMNFKLNSVAVRTLFSAFPAVKRSSLTVYYESSFKINDAYFDRVFEQLDRGFSLPGTHSCVSTLIVRTVADLKVDNDYRKRIVLFLRSAVLFNAGLRPSVLMATEYCRVLAATIIVVDNYMKNYIDVQDISSGDGLFDENNNSNVDNGFLVLFLRVINELRLAELLVGNSLVKLCGVFRNFTVNLFLVFITYVKVEKCPASIVGIINDFLCHENSDELLFSFVLVLLHESGYPVVVNEKLNKHVIGLTVGLNMDIIGPVIFLIKGCGSKSLSVVTEIYDPFRYLLLYQPRHRVSVFFDYAFRTFHVQWTVCGQHAKVELEEFLLGELESFLLENYTEILPLIYCETVPLGNWNVKRVWSLCKQKKRRHNIGTVECGVGNDAVYIVDGV